MAWMGYRLALRVLSPLHIGWRKVGNLQQTRPYVTGRNLWGALTARLVRNTAGTNYAEIGKRVDQEVAFSYFYPSTHPDKVTLWPWGEQWEEFAWTFLGGYAGTALQDGHGTEDGSLHETEFIASHTRDGEPVFLVGHLFLDEGCKLDWKNALQQLQLGGERGYGWGRVALTSEPERLRANRYFGLPVSDQDLTLMIPKGRPLLAHTLVADELKGRGTIEPFVGRETETTSGGFGQRQSPPYICWVPGSTFEKEMRFRIGPRGIWTPLQGAYEPRQRVTR